MSTNDLDRRIRVQYPGAIYHITSRGVQRSSIFRHLDDRIAFFERCEATVDRFGWRVFSVAQMTNHFHLQFQTPLPNLSRGAQYLLGQYAQGFNRRHGRTGHVFEARYRCHVVESEQYHWPLSRYVHRNPVPVIVDHPATWHWSSYPGYCDSSQRLPWVCYDELLAAWSGEFGASPEEYCAYVEGTRGRPHLELVDGWILGTEEFARQMRRLASPQSDEPVARRVRSSPMPGLDEVVEAVCGELSVSPEILACRSSRHPARAILAAVAARHSRATLEEIARQLGLAGRDSIHKKIQRVRASLDPNVREWIDQVERQLNV